MPAKSARQQRYMGMVYGWEKSHGGQKKKASWPSVKVAREFARKPKGGYRKG